MKDRPSTLTLDCWLDDGWYVGSSAKYPMFSQGESLAEVEANIQDAYRLVMAGGTPAFAPIPATARDKDLFLDTEKSRTALAN